MKSKTRGGEKKKKSLTNIFKKTFQWIDLPSKIQNSFLFRNWIPLHCLIKNGKIFFKI